MQRNSIYQTNIRYLFIFVCAVVYESISSIYPCLTPLFGVVFYLILLNMHDEKKVFPLILSFLYIFIFEIDKNFIPFSFLIFFFLYYVFLYEKIERFFVEKNYKIFFHILFAYMGYYLVNIAIDYLFDYNIPNLNYEYVFYIITDTLIVMVLL